MTDWCILRTSGPSTLPLAQSLNEAGFEAWTPVGLPDEPKRVAKGKQVVEEPLIRTFVFARADRLLDLVELSRSPAQTYRRWDTERGKITTIGHPHYSVFRHLGAFVTLPDSALIALRRSERQRKPRGKVKLFKVGDKVMLVEGAVAGLRGVVAAVQGKHAVVSFPACGFVRDATLPMWMLLDDDSVDRVGKGQASIARAA